MPREDDDLRVMLALERIAKALEDLAEAQGSLARTANKRTEYERQVHEGFR